MQPSNHTCCFTGHRSIDPRHAKKLAALLDQALCRLVAQGIHTFAAGGAVGFDTLAAEAVLGLRARFSHIRLVVVAPCADQADGWRRGDALRYERIRERADDYICLSARYTPGCMERRNRHLVDMSQICLAYCLRDHSGSAQTASYARRQGLSVINLADLL
jgi:uncharacterized phage-like protein YoqJ